MRTLLCICLTVTICVISGCLFQKGDNALDPDNQSGGQMRQVTSEIAGPHYAKLNSIGCLNCDDMETTRSANQKGDFDTIDNLIRAKRCFVLPTDTDIYIKERVKGNIVSAKLKDSRQLFYTLASNLVAE